MARKAMRDEGAEWKEGKGWERKGRTPEGDGATTVLLNVLPDEQHGCKRVRRARESLPPSLSF
jgi:hypothetical protein